MATIVSKIVLTGGPCAGKTTALARIEEYFSDLGYKVIIVGESATELINSGIRPFGQLSLSMLDFQDVILKYQLAKESVYDEAVQKLDPNCRCIIVYDRGLMDNKAYVSSEEFNYLLAKNHFTYLDLMDRYDMVLHLVTAALGALPFYTLDNNTARSESPEEAIALDRRTMEAWNGHRHLHIIDNSVTFEEKINQVINHINNAIGNPFTIKQERKYLIDIDSLEPSFLAQGLAIRIEQTYLENQDYEQRLRKRILGNDVTYYYTLQKQDLHGTSHVYMDHKISANEYNHLLSKADNYHTIAKTRYTFIYHNQCFKIDLFDNGVVLLEFSGDVAKLPSSIKIIEDETNNPDFYNANLAKIKTIKKTLS